MFSSREKELEELLRHQLFGSLEILRKDSFFENPHEFQEKYHLSVKAFVYLFAAVGQQINLVQLELTHVVYKRIQVVHYSCIMMHTAGMNREFNSGQTNTQDL